MTIDKLDTIILKIQEYEQQYGLEAIDKIDSVEIKQILQVITNFSPSGFVEAWLDTKTVYKNKGSFLRALYPYGNVEKIFLDLYRKAKEETVSCKILDLEESLAFLPKIEFSISEEDQQRITLLKNEKRTLSSKLEELRSQIDENLLEQSEKEYQQIENNNKSLKCELETLQSKLFDLHQKNKDFLDSKRQTNEKLNRYLNNFIDEEDKKQFKEVING